MDYSNGTEHPPKKRRFFADPEEDINVSNKRASSPSTATPPRTDCPIDSSPTPAPMLR